MRIRDATPDDWPALWRILAPIIAAGDTFSYDPDLTEAQARELWMLPAPDRTATAVDEDGHVVGTANMHTNRPGPGAHIASGNFMVPADQRGRGVGRALVLDAVNWARRTGFRGMQFNAVAASNHPALALYRSVGFEVVGTVPGAFRHPTEGFVGLHVLYLPLGPEADRPPQP